MRLFLPILAALVATLALSGCHLGHRAGGGYHRPVYHASPYRPAPATRVIVVRR